MLKTTAQARRGDLVWYLYAIILAGFGIFLILALISFEIGQIGGASPATRNWCGIGGAWIARGCLLAWGVAAFWLPSTLVGASVAIIRGWQGQHLALRLMGTFLMLPALCGLLHLLPHDRFAVTLSNWDLTNTNGLGGALGWFLCGPPNLGQRPDGILLQFLDVFGSTVVLIAMTIGALALLHLGLRRTLRRIWRRAYAAVTRRRPAPLRPVTRSRLEASSRSVPESRTGSIEDLSRRIASNDGATAPDAADLVERIRQRRRELSRIEGLAGTGPTPDATPTTGTTPAADHEPDLPEPVGMDETDDGEDEDGAAPPTGGDQDPDPDGASGTDDGEDEADDEGETPPPRRRVAKTGAKPPRAATEDYDLPSMDLLEVARGRDDAAFEAEKRETAKQIEDTFKEFNIGVRVVAATRGPVITQYEMELLDSGFRVGRLGGYEKDLQLKLATEGIRIVAPLPNKATVGVEVPNRHREDVIMRDLIEAINPDEYHLPIVIGRDVLGTPMVEDLTKMPHLLIAGATGMGKSVCMNAIICSILLFRDPTEVKFIMVDPKMVELASYEGIPHLLVPPITDMGKAHAALEWACKTMDERYFALRLCGVRNVQDFNALGEAEIRQRLQSKNQDPDTLPNFVYQIPYIIVLVDEYADMMMVNKEVEKSIVRLAAKSRACGIHMILTTQRPSADVVTGLIKSNLPARIAFRVTDRNNSRVVLDQGGAENLLGRGDMLFLPPGSSNLVRGQGVWAKDGEIESIIQHAKSQGTPTYDDSIFKIGAIALAGGGGAGSLEGDAWIGDRDFHEAVYYMFKYNRTGADFFRRRLNVGYNKATSYVEMLEDLGFLGPQQGTKAREIVRSWEEWLDLLNENGVERDAEDEIYGNPFA
jgi:S-DNA-T family DNA segregation ATPase FtsK/SpoIIIE